MNNEPKLKIQSYLDNELSATEGREVAALLEKDSNARALFTELKDTKALLVNNEPTYRLADSREFYWSRIERAIAATPQEPPRVLAPWWLRVLAPLAGSAAVLTLLVSLSLSNKTPEQLVSNLDVTETSALIEEEAGGISFHSANHGLTVVWVATGDQ
ncbi:MAG: hypothetical protein SFY81_16905 [Verrucomicrobiota bacterium]|nr:hypothetical protein [Verrucomicrobiota bacterium]